MDLCLASLAQHKISYVRHGKNDIGFQRHQTINVKILRKLFSTGTHNDTTKVCGDWQVSW